jgi:hypothetical protein
MHDPVLTIFPGFSRGFEGWAAYMYLDWDGNVTTAVGCLIDPLPRALTIPWKLPDGSLAPRATIETDWHRIKARQDLKDQLAEHAKSVTIVRLTTADIDAVVRHRLLQNEAVLKKEFLDWDLLPADAQLGIHSIAWAEGASFALGYPKFRHAVNARDFVTAELQCAIREVDKNGKRNLAIARRNDANRICFRNAARVVEDINHAGRAGLHLETLYYPKALS